MSNKMYSPEYYEGALGAYREEVESVRDAINTFGNGRIAQWSMLLDDYKRALFRAEKAENELAKMRAERNEHDD